MKTHKIKLVTFIIFIISFISCKNTEKVEESVQIVDSNLHVLIDVIVPKDDSFQIYFNEDGSDNFKGDNYVNIDIKGSPNSQKLDFKISDDFMPKQLRFDIGSNKEHGVIKINSFKLKYYKKVFFCNGPDFWKYFGNNTSIEYNKEQATAKLITNLPEGFDPIFGGTSNIPIELEKLYKNN